MPVVDLFYSWQQIYIEQWNEHEIVQHDIDLIYNKFKMQGMMKSSSMKSHVKFIIPTTIVVLVITSSKN